MLNPGTLGRRCARQSKTKPILCSLNSALLFPTGAFAGGRGGAGRKFQIAYFGSKFN